MVKLSKIGISCLIKWSLNVCLLKQIKSIVLHGVKVDLMRVFDPTIIVDSLTNFCSHLIACFLV